MIPEGPLPVDVIATENPSRGRVLVIDDEPDIRESLEALLSVRIIASSWRLMRPRG